MVTTLLAQAAQTTWPDVALFALFFTCVGFICWVMYR